MAKSKRRINPSLTSKSKRIKQPSEKPLPSFLDLPPFFALECETGKFCFKDCQKNDQLHLISKIHTLSRMTWKQILSTSRKGSGHEKIGRKSIKASIPSNITPDMDHFLAFRISGAARMVGYKTGQIFHILWIGVGVYDH